MRGKVRYLVYCSLFVLMMVSYIDRINLSIAAAPIAQEFGLSPVQMGYLFSAYLWTYIICLVPMGMLVDRFGTRGVISSTMALWSVAGAATGAAGTFTSLLISRLVLGIGEASGYPGGGRIIREWAPSSERGLAAGVLNSGAYAGPAFGSLLVGWIASVAGWRASFYVTGGIGIVVAIAWVLLYRRPEQASWLSAQERLTILGDRGPSGGETRRVPPMEALRTLLASPTMWALALSQGCAGYTLYLFLTWLPSYLSSTRGFDLMKMSAFSSVPYLAAMIFGLVLGWASDRLLRKQGAAQGGRRTMITVALLVSSVILLTPFVTSIWLILALFSISLSCVATAMAMNIALTNDLLEDSALAGVAVSFLILGGNIFGLIAPIATGYVVAATSGFSGAFAIAGVLLLMGAFVSFFLTRAPIGRRAAVLPQSRPGVAVR